MGFQAKIICDSIAPNGKRLTTIEATYPRFIHSEIMTHRDRARNSASSRAIPWPKMLERITNDPVIPIRFGSEQKGMQTGGEIDDPETARAVWLLARDHAIAAAQRLAELGVHKSICNRLTEPWMWITVVMTATEWKNFFRLRCHPDAEIHFQQIAGMIREAMANNTPTESGTHGNHLPYVTDVDLYELSQGPYSIDQIRKISVARVARVSYLTQSGIRDPHEDLKLFDRLVQGSGFGHFSPHEHIATPAMSATDRSGPFLGWKQFRKEFPLENEEG